MRIELHAVSKGRHGQALPPVSLSFESDAARLALAETEQRPTVLGLIASGRMAPDAGTVTVDGTRDAAALRRRVALVDAPDVCDPAPNVTVAGVAAEELMFAGRPSNPVSVRRWLAGAGMSALARTPIADVAPRERIALLLELTALRAGVAGMVLVSPDRHGGDPAEWWRLAEHFAARGYAMLVVAGEASAMVLEDRAPRAETDPAEAEIAAIDADAGMPPVPDVEESSADRAAAPTDAETGSTEPEPAPVDAEADPAHRELAEPEPAPTESEPTGSEPPEQEPLPTGPEPADAPDRTDSDSPVGATSAAQADSPDRATGAAPANRSDDPTTTDPFDDTTDGTTPDGPVPEDPDAQPGEETPR